MRLQYDPELLEELHDVAIAAALEASVLAHEGRREGVEVAATDAVSLLERGQHADAEPAAAAAAHSEPIPEEIAPRQWTATMIMQTDATTIEIRRGARSER